MSGLVVLALWMHGHGLMSLTRPLDQQLTSLGRLSGLIAADLLLVQVFLMARVPMIERSYGQDELARRHRLVGFWSFTLMLVHVGLISLGYTLSAHTDLVHETWQLVTTFPGMLLATAGTAALTLVALSSMRAARRALRYESWHLLHLYAYLGVGLSIPHEIWTGADFIGSPLARIYWWTAYAASVGAVLVFRVALPIWRSLFHRITVRSVTRHGQDVVVVELDGRHLERLPVHAGQFFLWRFLDGKGWTRANPYSLSRSPHSAGLQITVKDNGDGSRRLRRLKPGTRVLIEGPYGRLTGEARTRKRILMVACGIGITPLKALLETLPFAPGDAKLIYRARTEHDLVFRAELERLAHDRGIEINYLLGARNRRRNSFLPADLGNVSDSRALQRLVPDLVERDVYVCGPTEWMSAVADATRAAGLPFGQLHQERFSW